MDDSDVEVLDEHDDGGSGVGSADADVEEVAPCRRVTLPSVSMMSRARLEGGLAFAAEACDEAADPALGEAVGAGDLMLRAAFEDDGGDDKTGLRHPADAGGSSLIEDGQVVTVDGDRGLVY